MWPWALLPTASHSACDEHGNGRQPCLRRRGPVAPTLRPADRASRLESRGGDRQSGFGPQSVGLRNRGPGGPPGQTRAVSAIARPVRSHSALRPHPTSMIRLGLAVVKDRLFHSTVSTAGHGGRLGRSKDSSERSSRRPCGPPAVRGRYPSPQPIRDVERLAGGGPLRAPGAQG